MQSVGTLPSLTYSISKLGMQLVDLKSLVPLRIDAHARSRIAETILSVFQPTILSAACLTGTETRTLPRGFTAMIGFFLPNSSTAKSISSLIQLLCVAYHTGHYDDNVTRAHLPTNRCP